MEIHFIIILLVLTTLPSLTSGKAGKPCRRQSDCHSGLQVCNKQRICECFVGGRPSRKIMRLLEVCRSDTHKTSINGTCLYVNQCSWNGPSYGCISGVCSMCKPGFQLKDGTNCVELPTTTSTTETPLTEEEKDELRKNMVHRIIVISTIVCCSLAAFGVFVAVIRLKCEKKRRKRYPEQIYFQGNQTRLEDEPSAFPSAPVLDYLGPKDPKGFESMEALALPEYSENIQDIPVPEKIRPIEINDHDTGNHEEAVPIPSAPSPNQWDRWFPPIEDYYHARSDHPPPYDLNKYFKKAKS